MALRDAIAEAGGANLDLDGLAHRLDTEREVVLAALRHGLERGWLTGVELAGLSAGCGATGCTPTPSRPACRRCPLAGGANRS
jgi:hypothetical protein